MEAAIAAAGLILSLIANSERKQGIESQQVERYTPEQRQLLNSLMSMAIRRGFSQTPGLSRYPAPANSISRAFDQVQSVRQIG